MPLPSTRTTTAGPPEAKTAIAGSEVRGAAPPRVIPFAACATAFAACARRLLPSKAAALPMNTPPPGKGRVAVVDLSTASRRPRAVRTGRTHERVLAHVRARDGATKEDLLRAFPELPYPDLVAAVEDLAALGEVEVQWASPFRFVVGVRRDGERRSRSAAPVLAVS